MAANKIKFEMTLKELTFKFEGDYEHGQKLQLGINKALSDLGKLQGAAAGLEEPRDVKLIEADSVVTRTSRRRKRKAVAGNGEGNDNPAAATDSDEEASERRSLGVSPTQLVIDLRKADFFQTGKTSGQVVTELNRQGHTAIKDSDLTGVFLRLCRRQVLSRDKDASTGVWVYGAGPNNE